MPILLDQLVSALAGAVVDAQNQVQQIHIGELSRFFDKEGSPISVNLKIPRVNPDTNNQEQVTVSVPLVTLVNPKQISIQEMQVSLQVDLSEIARAMEKQTASNASIAKMNVQPYEWKLPEYQHLVTASAITKRKSGDVGLAQITLRITADETPEGLSRLLDHLNKSL